MSNQVCKPSHRPQERGRSVPVGTRRRTGCPRSRDVVATRSWTRPRRSSPATVSTSSRSLRSRAGRNESRATDVLLPDAGIDSVGGIRADAAADDPRGDDGRWPETDDGPRGGLLPARARPATSASTQRTRRSERRTCSAYSTRSSRRWDTARTTATNCRRCIAGGESTSRPMSCTVCPNRDR